MNKFTLIIVYIFINTACYGATLTDDQQNKKISSLEAKIQQLEQQLESMHRKLNEQPVITSIEQGSTVIPGNINTYQVTTKGDRIIIFNIRTRYLTELIADYANHSWRVIISAPVPAVAL